MKSRNFSRRSVLRGLYQGTAVGVALPFLEIFSAGAPSAYGATGAMPIRFGTWFWGCGMNPERWNPTTEGPEYDLPPELAAIENVREHVSVLSGFNVPLDGMPNQVHHSGVIGTLTGNAPTKPDEIVHPTLDVLIGDRIGSATRFRSIEVAADGDPRHSYSRRSTSLINPAEVSPLELYKRIFGAEFQDPNAAKFEPDPKFMIRQSVLSAVKDDRQRLMKSVGAHDRARLDDYFTSVRQAEQQLDIMLSEPEPLEACSIPPSPGETPVGTEIQTALDNHRLMARLLAMAVACDQTRVFNVVFSYGASALRKGGSNTAHHQLTHEEPVNSELGYQPQATYFVERSMEAWAEFVRTLASMPEGDGCVLDNCLVLAHSETSLAKTHDVFGLPLMIAGKGGGRVRSGIHVKGYGDPVTRIGLTLQQIMGVQVAKWGTRSMETSKTVSEMLT